MRWALALLLALTACTEPALSIERAPLDVTATPVPLIPDGTETTRGALRYLGGVDLNSTNPRFGGISSMRFLDDGETLLALTDRGTWLTLQISSQGPPLADVTGGWIMPLLDGNGNILVGKALDSESMVVDGDTVLVGFEGRHRIDRYDAPWGETNPVASPYVARDALGALELNGGIEGLTRLADGRLLVGVEEPDETGNLRLGIFGTDTHNRMDLWLERQSPFKLTDLATLPNGDVLTLERRFSILGGVGAQLRLIRAEALQDGATISGAPIAAFGPGDTVDNMEGLAVRENDGRIEIFIISDDNFNGIQRTLLLAFELMVD